MKQPCVYIMASRRNGTLYTGVTRQPAETGFWTSRRAGCRVFKEARVQDSGLVRASRQQS